MVTWKLFFFPLLVVAKVCFTAVADKGEQYGPFPADRVLIFETQVTSNNAYDPTSGKYAALIKKCDVGHDHF